MALSTRVLLLVLKTLSATSLVVAVSAEPAQIAGRQRSALLQTWTSALNGAAQSSNTMETPVTRVVGLLKTMQETLQKDMDEDQALYDKLACWCHTNDGEKSQAIADAEAKISELEASIEALSNKSVALKSEIKEIEADVAANKETLAAATAQREKELKESHGAELDNIQAIENLKAAIEVLSKHHEVALPQLSMSLLAVQSSEFPWSQSHESSSDRALDELMSERAYDSASDGEVHEAAVAVHSAKSRQFLQQAATSPDRAAWSSEEVATLRHALAAAASFTQARHGERYYPAYNSRSSEIMGVLKQMKEEMEGDHAEVQKREAERAAAFAELRKAKVAEIEAGEKKSEEKEDELAETDNSLAEAKEDVEQTKAALSEDQQFLMNLEKTCAEGSTNFDARKKARTQEITAVAETIQILTEDEARDAMAGTYKLVQLTSRTGRAFERRRVAAAASLRRAAASTTLHGPELSALATGVELDAFTKVKQAIDHMVSTLKQQQADEVKKNDWCKDELHSNEMSMEKESDHKEDLEASIAQLDVKAEQLTKDVAEATAQIAELQLNLQRASEDRKAENADFQSTFQDQTVTVEVLKKALERLAKYYETALLQKAATGLKGASTQTPPVPQAEYKPSAGADGVMSMIEKLILEAKDLIASSKKAEAEAQAAYEQTVADTFASVAALQKMVTSKTKEKAQALKDTKQRKDDLAASITELASMAKYEEDLHAECDYLLKNFDLRQQAMAQEIEALQQAKQILDGADLS